LPAITRAEGGFLLEVVAQLFQQAGVFGEALHQDVLGAFEGGLDVGDAFFGVDEACGFGFRRQGRVVEQAVGQLAEAGFQGDLALGAALLLVRQVRSSRRVLVSASLMSRSSCGVSLPCSSMLARMLMRRSSSSRR
jgi:hypothetical protein